MKKRVFVMDDSELYISIITSILEKEGMKVNSTTNDEASFDEISSFDPDVIIIDMIMPHKNGVEVIRQLKSTPGFFGLPVLLVSSEDVKSIKRDNPNIDDYINKSEAAKEIVNRIKVYANIGSVRKSIRDMSL